MNINLFFLFLGLLLSSFFLFFKPLKIDQKAFKKEIPLFEIHNFTMYEVDTQKLIDISIGEKGLRYKNRYVLYNFIYNDNLNENAATIRANKGVYKANIVTLTGDVLYTKTDGSEFQSQKVVYNRGKGYLKSEVPYTAFFGKNRVSGSYLFYDIKKDILKSKDVDALYYLSLNRN